MYNLYLRHKKHSTQSCQDGLRKTNLSHTNVFPQRLSFHNNPKLYYAKVKSVHLLFRFFSSCSITQFNVLVNQKITFSHKVKLLDNIRHNDKHFIPTKKHWPKPVLRLYRIIIRIVFCIIILILIIIRGWFY